MSENKTEGANQGPRAHEQLYSKLDGLGNASFMKDGREQPPIPDDGLEYIFQDVEPAVADIVGKVIVEAFFKDQDFHEAMRPVYRKLAKIGARYLKNPEMQVVSSAPDAFNSYMVSSYHAARAAEGLFLAASKKHIFGTEIASALIDIQHSFGLEAVVHLELARSFLTLLDEEFQAPIDIKEVKAIFERHFPLLRTARDSLAHQDERMLAMAHRKRLSKNIAQWVWQGGAMFDHLLDENLEEFQFKFHPDQYLRFLTDLDQKLI